jgi:putative NADPH-quinone reductase
MKIVIILGHPKTGSFNHAIAEAVVQTVKNNGHHAIFHDLYEEKFEPAVPTEEIPKGAEVHPVINGHCDEISNADGIIIIHPNWWGQPPAVLKGWIDRVIRPGVAYEFFEGDNGEGVPCGLLKARTALVFNTSNTHEKREREVFGDPLETIWKNCVFGLCGVKQVYRRTFGVIATSTPEQRQAWLREASEIVARYFPAAETFMM